jgi:hypothetical protein
MSTVCHWMKCLGLKYEVWKKGYYVDGHEKPAAIEYHKQFVARYLTYERNENSALENKGLVPKNSGYQYISDKDDEMVECHVDACREFQEKMNKETKFGGNLSVRLKKEENPLIIFGHDEAIFKQYLLMKKHSMVQMEYLCWYQKMMGRE